MQMYKICTQSMICQYIGKYSLSCCYHLPTDMMYAGSASHLSFSLHELSCSYCMINFPHFVSSFLLYLNRYHINYSPPLPCKNIQCHSIETCAASTACNIRQGKNDKELRPVHSSKTTEQLKRWWHTHKWCFNCEWYF